MVGQNRFAIANDGFTPADTSETPFILFRNPAGSGKLIRFIEMLTSNISSTDRLRFYRSPTITAVGSVINVNKIRPSGTITSIAQVYLNPTVSNVGFLVSTYIEGITGVSMVQRLLNELRFIEPGNDLLITTTQASAHIVNISAEWSEDSATV